MVIGEKVKTFGCFCKPTPTTCHSVDFLQSSQCFSQLHPIFPNLWLTLLLSFTYAPSQAVFMLVAHSYLDSCMASILVVGFLPNMWFDHTHNWNWPVLLGPAQTALTTGSSQSPPLSGCWLTAFALWPLLEWTSSCSVEFMQQWVHVTHKYLHTCLLEHWQKLLWNFLVLCCFCVFCWQLKQLARIKMPRRKG